MASVDPDAITAARRGVGDLVKHTPVVSSITLGEMVGGRIVLEAENLQRTGAFEVRGAMNKIRSLGDRARGGVTAGSAGNHAQALAIATARHGVSCEIFVPAGASISKIDACEGYGAVVHEGGASVAEAVALATARADEAGMVFCHPFDDPAVIAGQGTIGLELIHDLDDLHTVLVPLGGGGLAAGGAIAIKSTRPDVRVIGVQAEVCAPYAGRTLPTGPVATLADGTAVKTPGHVTSPLIARWLDDVMTVDEDTIADAMVLLLERAKFSVEGAGAVGAAVLLGRRVVLDPAGVTCAVLSGATSISVSSRVSSGGTRTAPGDV